MKLYIWNDIEHLTDNYHSGGGLVVIADCLSRAHELAESNGVKFNEDERSPALECNVETNKEECFVFQDAGCC